MDQTITFQTLTKLAVIDFGNKSKVWLVSSGNRKYALKELSKSSLTEVDVHHLFQEKAVLQSLKHPNIIELINTFKDEENVYLLISLAKGAPLSHILKQQRKFPLDQVKSIIHQCVTTIGYIHSQGYIYRDLKLSNVLLDSRGKVMFVDFGLSMKIDNRKETEVSGTRHAMSPEMFKYMVDGSTPQGYSYEIDWWAVGIMTYELLKGTPPFGLVGDDIFDNILSGIDSVDFGDIPHDGEAFIKCLLREDPTYRLGHHGQDEVLTHPFINGHSSSIVPNFNQMTLIESWCEFIEDDEELNIKGQDPFLDF